MSGSVSCTCVPNCHQTFAIPQNLCTLGQAAFWYEEGINKLVSRYDKCLNVQGDYVEKYVKVCDKTCIFCFFPIINKYLCMAKRSLLSRWPSYLNRVINLSVFITETECLLRGTDWVFKSDGYSFALKEYWSQRKPSLLGALLQVVKVGDPIL